MTENHIQLAVRMGSWGGIPIDGYTVNYVLLNKVCFLSVELGTRIATFLKKKKPITITRTLLPLSSAHPHLSQVY